MTDFETSVLSACQALQARGLFPSPLNLAAVLGISNQEKLLQARRALESSGHLALARRSPIGGEQRIEILKQIAEELFPRNAPSVEVPWKTYDCAATAQRKAQAAARRNRYDGPCRAEIADYWRAWKSIRTNPVLIPQETADV